MTPEEKLELTDEQEKAFKNFERAHKKCKEVGIRFYSVLEHIYALNGKYLMNINDNDGDVNLQFFSPPSIMDGDFDSWADDTHYAVVQ
jgi:hypothetical protein